MMTLQQCKLSHTSGSEGPRHDPYHYDEWTLTRQLQDGPIWKYVLHIGLDVTFEVTYDGRVVQQWDADEDGPGAWERLARLPIAKLDAYYQRVHGPFNKCPLCGSHNLGGSDGFAGEPIQFCKQCEAIIWSADPTPYIS
jgi:hypothetical protein